MKLAIIILLFITFQYRYCDVVLYPKNNKEYSMEADSGQAGSKVYKDRQGNTVYFKSTIDGINFIASKGWDLQYSYIETRVGGISFPHFIFKKSL